MTKFKNIEIKSNEELITQFETGDKPEGKDFANLIVSKANVIHTHNGDEIFIDDVPLTDILTEIINGLKPSLTVKAPNGTLYNIIVDNEGRLYTSTTKRKNLR